MKLFSERLELRGYIPEDWKPVHVYGSDADFSKYELWGPNSEEDTKKFVVDMIKQQAEKDRYKFDFAVCDRATGLLIGGCGIRRESQTSSVANLGWAITPAFQGKGLATEAAARLINFGLSDLGLKVIYATCDTRNVASYRVMEKLGMKRVGFLEGDKMQKGFLRDTYRYEILP
jgi:ribosomal-protein-alanine N-acetyltransferase